MHSLAAVTNTPVLSLVLPTYNERPNVANAVARITRSLESAGCSFEIIVVDDDSPDGTWMVAEELARHDQRVRVLRRQSDRGLATAVAAGWRIAQGQILGVMDADLQYPPETLPTLLEALKRSRADVAICSRYCAGASVQQWSAMRWVVSWTARLVARVLLPEAIRGIADPGAGYFLVRRRIVDGVDLRPRGFKILIEVLARGRRGTVIEVGLPYEGRKEGQSKFRGRQVVEYLAHLADLTRETGEMARSMRRAAIALTSLAVGLSLLWTLTEYGLHYLASAAIAAEAMLLTGFAGRTLHGTKSSFESPRMKAGRWHLLRFPGTAAGLVVLAALTEVWNVPYLASALVSLPVAWIIDHAFVGHDGRTISTTYVVTTSH